MRSVFLFFVVLSFAVQQFSCCCGIVCEDHDVQEETAQCAIEASSDHDCCDHDSEHGPANDESDHEHHLCVGSHVFFVLPNSLSVDFTPPPVAAVMMADLLKRLAQPTYMRHSEHSSAPLSLTSQQRRAILCVYSI